MLQDRLWGIYDKERTQRKRASAQLYSNPKLQPKNDSTDAHGLNLKFE